MCGESRDSKRNFAAQTRLTVGEETVERWFGKMITLAIFIGLLIHLSSLLKNGSMFRRESVQHAQLDILGKLSRRMCLV